MTTGITTSERGAPRKRPARRRPGAHGRRNNNQNTEIRRELRPRGRTLGSGKNTLRIIPLGGLEEVGKNMTIFEYGNDIIILDMGLQFPEENMHGIDYIIPNISYLKGKEKNVKAVILSHGHLDHIGAAPILLEKLGYPIVLGRPLTIAMAKHRQEDYKASSIKQLKTLQIKTINDRYTFGAFKVSFFQVDHSIMDAVGVILETPAGTVVHPGDWTLEKDEQGKPLIDYSFLSRLKRPTVLMLESLGAIDVRKSATQEHMKKNLTDLIQNAPGRVIVGTFASQIERVGWIINAAERLGKKVALDGYSMKMNIEIARKLGYIKAKRDTIIKVEKVHDYPENRTVVIATGAQGEGNAVLMRILTGNHRQIKLKKNDTVILSSSIIPGNENTIQRLKDELYRQSDNVIHGQLMDIHVSGHGTREDIAHILKTAKPDYFIPVYAYHYMLREAAKLARDNGFKPENVLVLDNGQVAEINQRGGHATKEKVDTSHVFVDGLGVGDVGSVVMRDRQVMADDGMMVIIAKINGKTGKLVGDAEIITRGFIYVKSSDKLMADIRDQVQKIGKKYMSQGDGKISDWSTFRGKMKEDLSAFIFKETEREPMILPVLIKV